MTRRLLAAFLGLTVLVLVVLVVPFGLTFADRERDDLLAGVERDAVAIASFIEDELDPGATQTGVDLQTVVDGYERRTGGRVVIVDPTGLAVADSDPPQGSTDEGVGRDFSSRPEIADALAGEVARGTRSSTTLGARLVFVAVPVASGGEVHGAVRITYPTEEVDERVARNWVALAGLSAVTLAVAGGLSVLLASSVTRPLRRLQAATTSLGAGDLATRAPTEGGPPEVRAVAQAFNRMADQLAELVGSQEAFVADASHELRTPLTALRLRLEMLEGGPDTEAALSEVERMSRVIDGLLALARADRPEVTGAAAPIDLRGFVEERREAWEPLAGDAQVSIEVTVEGAPVAVGVRDRLAQVVDNLLANAIDASPPGATVALRARAEGAVVAVHVVDEGPGMSAEQRERAFDRFWRADARRGGLGGTGLGLAIAAKLAAADGGGVRLDEAASGGVDAVVRYPAAG